MTKTTTKIETNCYRNSHGNSPRGTGYWGFHPNSQVDSLSPEIFWFSGTYTEAAKQAKAHFSALGISYVQVLP